MAISAGRTVARHQVVLRDGKVIPHCQSNGNPGASNPTIDMTAIDDGAQVFRTGLSSPGTLDFTLFYVPSNPIHRAIIEDRDSGTVRRWAVRYAGAVENNRYTEEGATVKTVSASITAASGNTPARLVVSDSDRSVLEPGDFVGTSLVIDDIDGDHVNLKQATGSATIAAVSTATNMVVKRPAVKIEWDGLVANFSIDSAAHDAPRTATVSVQLTGSARASYGTPDL